MLQINPAFRPHSFSPPKPFGVFQPARPRFSSQETPTQPATPPEKYDVLIVGAGPAGVTAAVYAVRRRLKTLLLDKAQKVGGYVAQTNVIDNYPASPTTSGKGLAARYRRRLNHLNSDKSGLKGLLDLKLGHSVMKMSQDTQNEFDVAVENNPTHFKARSVIVATGIQRKKVPIKGFSEFLHKGVSMCTTCDGPLFKDKDVVMIGHNQAAVDAALYMAALAKNLYFFSGGKPIQASAESLATLKAMPAVREVSDNAAVTEIQGKSTVEKVIVKPTDPAQPLREIAVQGVFMETDLVSSAKFASGLVSLDEQGQVFVDENLNTGIPGLFAAGDVTPEQYKQITIAEAHGSKAALKAAEYLLGKDIKADYGKNPIKKP